MKKCPKCGTKFEGMPERCPGCGVKFAAKKTETSSTNQTAKPASKPNEAPARPYVNVATNRGLFKLVFFSIITLGIYGLVYLSKYQRDLNAIRVVYGERKGKGVFAMILLGIITLGIYPLVWNIQRICATYHLAELAKTPISGSSTFVIVSSLLLFWTIIVPLIAYSKMIQTMNGLCFAFKSAPREAR